MSVYIYIYEYGHKYKIGGRGCAFHFAEVSNFMEIQSVYCPYLQNGLEILSQILKL